VTGSQCKEAEKYCMCDMVTFPMVTLRRMTPVELKAELQRFEL
jgi:hypothetical protein